MTKERKRNEERALEGERKVMKDEDDVERLVLLVDIGNQLNLRILLLKSSVERILIKIELDKSRIQHEGIAQVVHQLKSLTNAETLVGDVRDGGF